MRNQIDRRVVPCKIQCVTPSLGKIARMLESLAFKEQEMDKKKWEEGGDREGGRRERPRPINDSTQSLQSSAPVRNLAITESSEP